MRIVWRTRKEATTAVAMVRARMTLIGTAVAEALDEAKRDKPNYQRIVQLLTRARNEHQQPLRLGGGQ